MRDLRDHRVDLTSIGTAVVGISPDMPDKQLRFDEKYGLGFPLLSDPDHATAEAYGAWGEKHRDGKTTIGLIRSSFLVDEEGRIEQAIGRGSHVAAHRQEHHGDGDISGNDGDKD